MLRAKRTRTSPDTFHWIDRYLLITDIMHRFFSSAFQSEICFILDLCEGKTYSFAILGRGFGFARIANVYGFKRWLFRNIFSVTKKKPEPIKSMQELQLMGQLLLQMLVPNSVRKLQLQLQSPIQNYSQLL